MVKISDLTLRAIVDSFTIYTTNFLIAKKKFTTNFIISKTLFRIAQRKKYHYYYYY